MTGARFWGARHWRELREDVPIPVVWFAAGVGLVAALALFGFVTGVDWVLFKLGEENNVPTWYSSLQLGAVGIVLAAIAVRAVPPGKRNGWAVMTAPALFLFLSLDEVAMIHERLGDWLQTDLGLGAGLRTGPWMFVFIPLIAAAGVVAVITFRQFFEGRPAALLVMVAGVVLFGFSAVGLEGVANLVVEGSLAHKVLGFLEETGEMVAVTLILWGSLLVARAEGVWLAPRQGGVEAREGAAGAHRGVASGD